MNRETINRLSPETASRALQETVPRGNKPLQVQTSEEVVRSIHGVAYSRLWNADLLSTVNEFATHFEPPPPAFDGSTGLYCGEEDCFAFLIDPAGWIDIAGQAFAPGMFVWNSEVGRRSFGIQSFWFQAVCQNHIVWDCTDVSEFKRKHTGKVAESLNEKVQQSPRLLDRDFRGLPFHDLQPLPSHRRRGVKHNRVAIHEAIEEMPKGGQMNFLRCRRSGMLIEILPHVLRSDLSESQSPPLTPSQELLHSISIRPTRMLVPNLSVEKLVPAEPRCDSRVGNDRWHPH